MLTRRELVVVAAMSALVRRPQAQAISGTRAGEPRVVAGVRLCWCPPGRFVMGSPPGETGRRSDEAQVPVTLTRGFWMGQFEVTQAEWVRVVGRLPERPPTERYGLGDDIPIYWVSYLDAELFCARATARARVQDRWPEPWAFRMPTEAQWEYACRAGTTTMTAFGDRVSHLDVNFERDPINAIGGVPPGKALAVGSYRPNAWNIHDMHGNVWEWCRDWYHATLPGGVDPDLSDRRGVPNRDGTYSRVRRGGAWVEEGWACRAAMRLRYEPERTSDHIGLRVALSDA